MFLNCVFVSIGSLQWEWGVFSYEGWFIDRELVIHGFRVYVNMFSSSTAAACSFCFVNNFEFWILWRTFVIFGIILHAINSRILIKKRMNPMVHNAIIFKVSTHENIDPMLLLCCSVTIISDNAFVSVPCSCPTRSFRKLSCSIFITSCAG